MKRPKNSKTEAFNSLPKGLELNYISPDPDGCITISDRDEFSYYCYNISQGRCINVNHLACSSVFVPNVNNCLEKISVNQNIVRSGGSALAELTSLKISAVKGSGYVLVAGSKQPTPNAKKQIITHNKGEYYHVNKPWGHELWINGEHPIFNFKEVFIKKGFQTSLQYHNEKIEAALLFKGICEIFYKSNPDVNNDEVSKADISFTRIDQMGKICVEPKTLHRVGAYTDMYYYEVSTPQLDDVIRVHDDNNRGHGRIKSEHIKAP